MNVIVSNKQKLVLDNANIDAIKDLNGLFNVQDLINNFKNYFFSKMIIDATAIVDFATPDVLKKLSTGIGNEKIIILLPQKPEPPKKFLELLINTGIYNFTTDINEVLNLIQTPNTIEKIRAKINGETLPTQGMTGLLNTVNTNYVLNNAVHNNNTDLNNINYVNTPITQNTGLVTEDMVAHSNQNMNINDYVGVNTQVQNNVQNTNNDINNYAQTVNNINNVTNNPFNNNVQNNDINNMQTINTNSFNNVPNNDINNVVDNYKPINSETSVQQSNMFIKPETTDSGNKYILGIKNLTEDAGTTTLIFMLKHVLEKKFNKTVTCLEIENNSFELLGEKGMLSIMPNQVEEYVKSVNTNIILIDLNKGDYASLCNDTIYLLEPSTIKVNELMARNRQVFEEYKKSKIVLNKSMLSSQEISIFSNEAGVNFFINIPPINDRQDTNQLDELINKLGINSQSKKGFFGLFK